MQTLVKSCMKKDFTVLAQLHNLIRRKYFFKYTSVRNMCMVYFWELLVCIAWILLYKIEHLQNGQVGSATPAVHLVRLTWQGFVLIPLVVAHCFCFCNLISWPTDKHAHCNICDCLTGQRSVIRCYTTSQWPYNHRFAYIMTVTSVF